MKRYIKRYFAFIFLAMIAAIAILVGLYYSTLATIVTSFATSYGLTSIFIAAFLLDVIAQPLAPDLPIIAGLYYGLNPFSVIIVATAASFLASITAFYLGRMLGEKGLRAFINEKKYNKWKKAADRYGDWVLPVAALTPVPYVPACWMAGTFRLNFVKFLALTIIPRFVRFSIVVYLALFLI